LKTASPSPKVLPLQNPTRWEKNTQDEGGHFYVRFINWGTIYRPPQEFIYATGREADAELQKIAEQEYQAYLDRTVG
jgi:HK97 gp10 family phage protein